MILGRLAEESCRMNLVEAELCLWAVTSLDGEYKEENVDMMDDGVENSKRLQTKKYW